MILYDVTGVEYRVSADSGKDKEPLPPGFESEVPADAPEWEPGE
ncbi:hypothetical protein [Paenibacillus kobensis]|nr:hypothetical protein [Paenibacillus kobensis]